MSLLRVLSTCILVSVTVAQLPLPTPPYLPPNASFGAVRSGSTSIPNPQWSNLLGNLVYFYDAQRSGRLPESNRVSWRNDSALDDGSDVELDLSGGYFDAGDYIKATYPLSFTLSSICWGASVYGRGYDITNQTNYLDSMLRWGLDWLVKAHPSNSTLFVLVRDADNDLDYWGGDQGFPTPRKSYQVNDTSPGTDVAALAAAAFASCSALYATQDTNSSIFTPASLQNDSYAAQLLDHAEQLYNFAVNATGGQQVHGEVVPEDPYGSRMFEDDLTYAALFLARATNSSAFYDEAVKYYEDEHLNGWDVPFTWDLKIPALPVLLVQIANAFPGFASASDVSQWQKDAEDYFDNVINDHKKTKGGLLWYDGVSDTVSLNPALNAALLLNLYAPFATSADKRTTYTTFAKEQLDYALGDNPMSAPYVVGSNPNSPKNPHSAPASGGNDIADVDNSPPEMAYVLYGAVLGGPDKRDRFFDIRSDWPQTEPALDYNAPMLSLAALQAMNDTNDPFFTQLEDGAYEARRPEGLPCDAAFQCGEGHDMSLAEKIGMAVGIGIAGLLILGLGLRWVQVARRK